MSEFQKVKSSNLDAVRYDAETATLYVVFSSGKEYFYEGVSQDIFDDLMASESKGRYFHAHILRDFYGQLVQKQDEED